MSQAGIINIAGGGGGGSPIQTVTGNDGVATPPTANNINLFGLTVANATNVIPVYVKNTGTSTDSIEVQVAEAAASSNINNAGLTSFNSADFTVDANGYVSLNNIPAFSYVQINHASSPYTALSTDYYISADPTAGTISILLPNAPTTYRQFIIKDRTGQASTNHISVTTVGGAVTIDGLTTYPIAGNYGAINLIFNGTSYEVY